MSEQTLEQRVSTLEKEIAELKGQVSVRNISIDFNCNESIDLEVPQRSITEVLHQKLSQQFGL